MNKIRNIYTFGTSFTKGGGFEFDAVEAKSKLEKAYIGIGEEMTQENFSWPGQLKKLIKDNDINVINLAESGYGNERMYYEAHKIITSEGFNTDTDIFLFEFSYLGRKQFYSRDINNPIIMNYSPMEHDADGKRINKSEYNGHAWRYFKSDNPFNKILKTNQIEMGEFFQSYMDKYLCVGYASTQMINNITLFLSFLTKRNIQFWFMQPPLSIDIKYFDRFKWDDRIITFDRNSHGFMLDYAIFSMTGPGTIDNETNGYIQDGHTGILGNKLIATKTFNHLIKQGLIDSEYAKIDDAHLKAIQNKINLNVKFTTSKTI